MMMRATIPMDVLIIANFSQELALKYISRFADATTSRIQIHVLQKALAYFTGLPANAGIEERGYTDSTLI